MEADHRGGGGGVEAFFRGGGGGGGEVIGHRKCVKIHTVLAGCFLGGRS